MKRIIVETATGFVKNNILLPDDWTGVEGEWQLDEGYHLEDRPDASKQDHIIDGAVVKRVAPPPPTKESLYDKEMKDNPSFFAIVEMINEGTLIPGGKVDHEILRSATAAKMRELQASKEAADVVAAGRE